MSKDAERYAAEEAVAKEIGVASGAESLEQTVKEFGLISENAIPIPKVLSKVYKKRFDDGLKALKDTVHMDWRVSVKEFLETGTIQDAEDHRAPRENIVRSTIETMVDHTYMQNPDVEITSTDPEDQPYIEAVTTAITNLINRRAELNLRPKIIKRMLWSHLTNAGTLRLDFQEFDGSKEKAAQLYDQVQKAMRKTNDTDKVQQLSALLSQIYDVMDRANNFGVSINVTSPFSLIIDEECESTDLSGCKWLMERDLLKKDHIISKYMLFDTKTEKYVFRYDPSVTFDQDNTDGIATPETVALDILETLMPEKEQEIGKLVAQDAIPVVWVWDKNIRKKILFIEGRWETPLWVYEDTLGLTRFFQHFIMPFSIPLGHVLQKGEVSSYIGFQKEINRIYEQEADVRNAAFNLIVYNNRAIDKKEVDAVLSEARSRARGLRAIGVSLRDQDRSLADVLAPFRFPVADFAAVFDKTGLRKAITDTSRISEALRGSEYKAHTTNDAVQTYAAFAEQRIHGAVDRVEDAVEEVIWALLEIMVSKFTQDDIARLTSPAIAEAFRPMPVKDFNRQFTVRLAAGSTEKPTSQNKKKEALGILQILGQFGKAAPITVITIVSRLLTKVFSKDLVTPQDLEQLRAEGQAQMQRGVSTGEPTNG